MIDVLAANPLARAVGVALVEFVWQGAVVGVTAALLLIALRRSSPQVRYLVACVALALLTIAPLVTTAAALREISPSTTGMPANDSTDAVQAPLTLITSPAPPTMLPGDWITRQLPAVLLIWIGGVAVLTVQLFAGWLRTRLIHRHAAGVAADAMTDTLARIAGQLRVTRAVRLIESAIVEVPAVIGWLRPVIVLPASALAGLTPTQLEAILAHELAHVRRGDYLVNVAQCVIEILLFYHPAVWWVSKRIRVEREHCCDDVAAEFCDDRAAYARALVSLEELRADAPAFAVAASGGELLSRIRRLLDPRFVPGPRLSGGVAMSVALTVFVLALQGPLGGTPAVTDWGRSSNRPVIAANLKDRGPLSADIGGAVGLSIDATTGRAAPLTASAQQPRDVPAAVATSRGGLRVVVTDATGGALPGAEVSVVWPATQTTLVTDSAGAATLNGLPVGSVRVTVKMPGFRTLVRPSVPIRPNETSSIQAALELGAVSEAVAVAAPRDPQVTRSVAELLDAAAKAYREGRNADAVTSTSRALDLLRSEQTQAFRDGVAATTAQGEAFGSAPPPPPPGMSGPSRPIRVGGNIRPPLRLKNVSPIYPAEARAAGIQGMVILEAVIGTDGAVKDARVVKSVPGLDDAARAAVLQGVYMPTLLNGQPVEVLMTATVNFTLN
ncbi:MAG: M56 family metallopeptidase [Vicinamibacterales bacterium]